MTVCCRGHDELCGLTVRGCCPRCPDRPDLPVDAEAFDTWLDGHHEALRAQWAIPEQEEPRGRRWLRLVGRSGTS